METLEPQQALAGAIELILEAISAGAYVAIETRVGGADMPDAGEPLELTASGAAILATVNQLLAPARLLVWRHDPDLNPPDSLRKEPAKSVHRDFGGYLLRHRLAAETVRGDEPFERGDGDCGSDGHDPLGDVAADGGGAGDLDLGGHESIGHPYRDNANKFDQFAASAAPLEHFSPPVKVVLR